MGETLDRDMESILPSRKERCHQQRGNDRVRSGRRVLTFPHGDYVPVSGNGMRLLLHGFSRLYAVEPKRPHARQLAH